MLSTNELLRDAAVDHAVDLTQYSAHVVRRMITILNRVDAALSDALTAALLRLPAESFTVQRLESLLTSVKRLNLQAYARVERELTKELKAFAATEAQYQYDLFRETIPTEVRVSFRVARVSVDQVRAAALSRPFQGRLLRDWAKKLPADRMQIIRNSVSAGFLEGKTVSQMVAELRGTRANSYADGVINRSRRDLEAVVDTAVKHTAAVARDRMMEANADIIKAVAWVATLDTKTSVHCRIRDTRRYTVKDHKPIGHQIPWLGGPGRIHYRCRSGSAPVLKSWRELGINAADLSPGTRASMDGQVPADMTFAQWLKRQSAYRQEQVLGATRARLMRNGGMEVPDFYTANGQFLSLKDLRARNSEAFARAGL